MRRGVARHLCTGPNQLNHRATYLLLLVVVNAERFPRSDGLSRAGDDDDDGPFTSRQWFAGIPRAVVLALLERCNWVGGAALLGVQDGVRDFAIWGKM